MYDLLHTYSEGVPFAIEERSGIITVIRELSEFTRKVYLFEAVANYVSDKPFPFISFTNSRTFSFLPIPPKRSSCRVAHHLPPRHLPLSSSPMKAY